MARWWPGSSRRRTRPVHCDRRNSRGRGREGGRSWSSAPIVPTASLMRMAPGDDQRMAQPKPGGVPQAAERWTTAVWRTFEAAVLRPDEPGRDPAPRRASVAQGCRSGSRMSANNRGASNTYRQEAVAARGATTAGRRAHPAAVVGAPGSAPSSRRPRDAEADAVIGDDDGWRERSMASARRLRVPERRRAPGFDDSRSPSILQPRPTDGRPAARDGRAGPWPEPCSRRSRLGFALAPSARPGASAGRAREHDPHQALRDAPAGPAAHQRQSRPPA